MTPQTLAETQWIGILKRMRRRENLIGKLLMSKRAEPIIESIVENKNYISLKCTNDRIPLKEGYSVREFRVEEDTLECVCVIPNGHTECIKMSIEVARNLADTEASNDLFNYIYSKLMKWEWDK